jgi:ABC-type multidrug transport system ATPase subunit
MRLEGVSKRYGRRTVLDRVDLALPHQTCLVVTGTNGSGKSTLLRILAGLTEPTGGVVADRPVRVAYVPERFPGRLGLTARSYLRHFARIRGLDRHAAHRRIDELAERLGLGDLIVEPLWTLSRGSAQKVAIAQAFLAPCDLIVLDEPWSGLDRLTRPELTVLADEAVRSGARVVVAEHLPEYAASIATAATVVADGMLSEVHLDDLLPADPDPEYVDIDLIWPSESLPPKEVFATFLDDADAREEYDATGEEVWLRVNRPNVDGLLAAALGAGWSVRGVYPAPVDGHDEDDEEQLLYDDTPLTVEEEATAPVGEAPA